MSGKSVWCRIGLHSWCYDSALFSSVRRCNRCGGVDDERAARQLERESAALWALPADASLTEVWGAAANAVLGLGASTPGVRPDGEETR